MSHPLDLWRGSVFGSLRDNQFQRAVERLFDDWSVARPSRGDTGPVLYNPHCEISETKNQYAVKVDLPGVEKDQIKIDLHEGQLTISGERKEEVKKEDDHKRHFSEFYYGSFSRSFTFPTPVDAERVEARYDAGVLNITIPKSGSTRTRQISVK